MVGVRRAINRFEPSFSDRPNTCPSDHARSRRCGNDPFSAGGYGLTNQGDHVEGNPFSPSAYMVGGVGKIKLSGVSSTAPSVDEPAPNQLIVGLNTQFTKQFRGYSSHDAAGEPLGNNPFKLVVVVGGAASAREPNLDVVRNG